MGRQLLPAQFITPYFFFLVLVLLVFLAGAFFVVFFALVAIFDLHGMENLHGFMGGCFISARFYLPGTITMTMPSEYPLIRVPCTPRYPPNVLLEFSGCSHTYRQSDMLNKIMQGKFIRNRFE